MDDLVKCSGSYAGETHCLKMVIQEICIIRPILTKNCFICSEVSPVKEDHLQPVHMVDHDENHHEKYRGSKTAGEFHCVPWRYY